MCASCKTTSGGAITPEAILAKGGDEATMLAQILEEMKKLSTSNAALQAKVRLCFVSLVPGWSRSWKRSQGNAVGRGGGGRVVPRSPVSPL